MRWLEKHLLSLLLLATAALYFPPLGIRALWDSDEGRYAEIAHEMIQWKDWISPHLNSVLYFEKPPLMYWLTAGAQLVFGQNAFAARFWCATFALLAVGITYAIGKKWHSERAGLLAGAMLATSVLYFSLSQFLVLDMALTFWMTVELWAMVQVLSTVDDEKTSLRRPLFILALGAAGGVLTKGPVAIVLPGAVFLCTILYTGRVRWALRLPYLGPLALTAVLTLPWFIVVSLRHPFFPSFFFIHEHVARFLTNVHQRTEPFYFFIPVVLAGFFPWSLLLPKVIWSWWTKRATELKTDSVAALLAFWVVVIVLFFSMSHSKLVGYVLPVFPALALLVARVVDDVFDESQAPLWVQGAVVSMIGVFVGALIVLKTSPAFLQQDPIPDVLGQRGDLWLMLGLGVFLLVGVWGMRKTSYCIGGLLLVQVLLLASVGSLAPRLDSYKSARGLAEIFNERSLPTDSVVSYGISFENRLQTFLYYSGGRRLKVLGDPGELSMGAEHDPNASAWFAPEADEQRALLALPDGTWGVTDMEHWKALGAAAQDHFAIIEKQNTLVLFQKIQ